MFSTHAAGGTAAVPRPRLIALAYGRFAPGGAPHRYLALRFKLEEAHGQILETAFDEVDARGKPAGMAGVGDSECGIGGRRNGGIETTFIPLTRPLARGIHHIRVMAVGSLCGRGDASAQSTRVFVLRIGGPSRRAVRSKVRLAPAVRSMTATALAH